MRMFFLNYSNFCTPFLTTTSKNAVVNADFPYKIVSALQQFLHPFIDIYHEGGTPNGKGFSVHLDRT